MQNQSKQTQLTALQPEKILSHISEPCDTHMHFSSGLKHLEINSLNDSLDCVFLGFSFNIA